MHGKSAGKAANSAAFAGLLFLLLRLLAVTHYDWESAFAMADTINFDDVIGVLIGTFLGASTLTGLLLALLLPFLAARHWAHIRAGDWSHLQTLFILVMTGVFVSVLLTSRRWTLLLVVLAAGALTIAALHRSGRGSRLVTAAYSAIGTLLAAALLVLGGLTDTVWVPLERITLTDGTTVKGYVVGSDPGFVKVLLEEDRAVETYDDSQVASRHDA
ncbi:hypothetical protein [Actinomadura macrotermitis]|uniref:Uncharacterized protein n=1 Tax=Actinomadura macrotermitis TaxID=2585200 RepID=A0A7K0C754_9ACTN|nr:hypothetical protein [Actinomadura macrotermitis]MQY09297.1 hypothetical protein [Actinomadura macrotermitis]